MEHHHCLKIILSTLIIVSVWGCSSQSDVENSAEFSNRDSANQTADALKEAGVQSPSNEPSDLLKMTAPNPDSMDQEVAKVVAQAWQTLQSNLSQDQLSDAQRADAYANYGLAAFGNGLSIPAEIAFENATRLAPEEVRWVYFLALIHQYNGKLERAIENFKKVLKLRPQDTPSKLRMAQVYFEKSEMETARALYQTVLEAKTEPAAAYYGLGRIASFLGQHADAITHFEHAINLQPDADRINYFLGMSYRNLGNREKAKQHLARHGSNEPSFADPLFDQISGGESRIDGLWAHMNAGSQAFVDQNYALAVKEFQLATQDLPNDSRSWQSLGMALNKKGDRQQSINAYETALSLDQNNAVIHQQLAKLHLASGALLKAEQHIKTAVKIDPRMIDAYRTYANILTSDGRSESALGKIDAALELDPQDSDLLISRAKTLVALDRASEASQSLEVAVKESPHDVELRSAYALVLADAGDLNAALKETETALASAEAAPTKSRIHFATGQIYLRLNNPAEAINSFGLALRANPNNRNAALELARSFIRIKNYQQALGTYEVYLNKWPAENDARVEAARVAIMLGDGAKGVAILTEGAAKQTASARLLGSLARLLVLSTEASINNPELALEYAERALLQSKAPQHKETLALCHSAKGDFAEAVTLQQQIISQVDSAVSQRVVTRMRKNLTRYQNKTLGRLPFDAS